MPFWGWIVVGAVLLGAETVVDAQFYLVFFGAASLVTGGLVLVFGPLPPGADWALFGVLSIASTAAFRRRVYQRLRGVDGSEVSQGTIGEFAVAREPIPPGGRGQVELRGAVWQGHNRSDAPIAPGERARVVAVAGLVLELRRGS
jgi:membrane protein implicated in regulation of membrane protease activity